MSYQHKELAQGRWKTLSFVEKMANIGSEVERTLNWKAKKNEAYANLAFERALELIDLTLESETGFGRIREVARVREGFVDYFYGDNAYASNDEVWKKYFYFFTYAARRNT